MPAWSADVAAPDCGSRGKEVSLVGVDFSPVAVGQAAHRAALFGLSAGAIGQMFLRSWARCSMNV